MWSENSMSKKLNWERAALSGRRKLAIKDENEYWPAPGSEDTELGVFIGPEVRHGEAEVYARVQA